MPVPAALPPEAYLNRPQVVERRSVADDPGLRRQMAEAPRLTASNVNLAAARLPVISRVEVKKEEPLGASNRPKNLQMTVMYVNGMETSESLAREARRLVSSNLGMRESDVRLVYNSRDANVCTGMMNVTGGIISSRWGAANEPEAVGYLRSQIDRVIKDKNQRLMVVGHSQGSLIFQNASDREYDSFCETEEGRQLWERSAGRIEGVFYAPIIRHTVPGMQVVGFTSSGDVPGRGAACGSGFMAGAKNFFGWREYQKMDMFYLDNVPASVRNMITDPVRPHDCMSLILKDARFNYINLGFDASTQTIDPERLAERLAVSIQRGSRSDEIHREITAYGVSECGAPFASSFLAHVQREGKEGYIDAYKIDERSYEHIQRVSQQRSR